MFVFVSRFGVCITYLYTDLEKYTLTKIDLRKRNIGKCVQTFALQILATI